MVDAIKRNAKGQFVKGFGFWTGRKRPGLVTSTTWEKGNVPWNKGMAKTKIKKESNYGKVFSERRDKFCPECGEFIMRKSSLCRSCANKGDRSPFYIHGKATEHWTEREIIKATARYRNWRKAVFLRDNWTCQMCGVRGNYLIADHKKSFRNYPELRFDVDNGRTLCKECNLQTPNYGGRAIHWEGGGVYEFQS